MLRLIDLDRLSAYQRLLALPSGSDLHGIGHKTTQVGDLWRVQWRFPQIDWLTRVIRYRRG
jgi:hypothetical protein